MVLIPFGQSCIKYVIKTSISIKIDKRYRYTFSFIRTRITQSFDVIVKGRVNRMMNNQLEIASEVAIRQKGPI